MITERTLLNLVDILFRNISKKTRKTWLNAFLLEEFEKVEDLKHASDDSWKKLTLPENLKSSLRTFIYAF